MNEVYKTELELLSRDITFANERILVTGASGLIGSVLVEAILLYNQMSNSKVQVYAMARNTERLHDRFSEWREDDNLHLVSGDVSKGICDDVEFDLIIHLASNADPKTYAQYPAETITSNTIGIYNILEYARKRKGTKVFFASSMEVYGLLDDNTSITESMYGLVDFNCLRQGYSESKRTSELMCKAYWDEYRVPCWIGRLGYIYGCKCKPDDSKVVFQFIKNALGNEPIVMKSDGRQRRAYCYYIDAVSAILCIINKGEYGESYNIADRESVVSIKELAELIANKSGTEVVFERPSKQETKGYSRTMDMILNSEKLEKLGWNPVFHLNEGIDRTIYFLKED